MSTMVAAEAKVPTVQLLFELTQLAKKGLISYVLPALPMGSGFIVGWADRETQLAPEQVDKFVIAAVQAGVYP
jgi:hypothetical protein